MSTYAQDAPDTADDQSADALLQTAIDALHDYIAHAGSDDVDTNVAAQCLAKLQSIKAQNQKQDEAAMGTTPAHKAMARSISSIAAQAHGGGGGY